MTVATGQVVTLCGDGNIGSDDGTNNVASFNYPFGIASYVDPISLTDIIYVADLYNHKIRRVQATSGVVTTLAGDGNAGLDDGTSSVASFNQPSGLGLSDDGAKLYVSTLGGSTIRAVATSTGIVKTVAGDGVAANDDGSSVTASFNMPMDMAFSIDSSRLYIAGGLSDHSIRILRPAPPPPSPPPPSPGVALRALPREYQECVRPNLPTSASHPRHALVRRVL